MKRIAIFGAGGLGKTVADALRGYHDFTFLDDSMVEYSSQRLRDADFIRWNSIIVAIGDNRTRKAFCDLVIWVRGELVSVQSSHAFVSDHAKVGKGTFIGAGAHVGADATIGKSCIVNTNASVGHDCQIGDYVNICDGATLGGGVVVGDLAFIGLNATILPRTRIGRGAMIAAGAVVFNHVGDGERVTGNPASEANFTDLVRPAGRLPKNPDASTCDSAASAPDRDTTTPPTATDPEFGPGHE
jgi:sugar O-acyltransferase (sialic acid O-acetyltransferase NeuD family)